MRKFTTRSLLSAALRSRFPALAVTSLIALIGVAGYFGSRATAAQPGGGAATPPAPKVTVAPVEERMITEYEEITGRVDSLETVELRARVSGHIEAVRFQAGQLVKKGDVLFEIDPRWYRAQFDLARAQADQARAHAEIAEREARRTGQGLWQEKAYADRPAAEPEKVAYGRFAFVRGKVTQAERIKDKVYLNFGSDWKSDFTVTIAAHDLKTFRKAGVDPLNLEGKVVRVRGWVDHNFGPMITVTHPAQIETLGESAAKP